MKEQCKQPGCGRTVTVLNDGYCMGCFHSKRKQEEQKMPAPNAREAALKKELNAYEQSVMGIRSWKYYKF